MLFCGTVTVCITAVVLTISSSVRCVGLFQHWLLCISSLKIKYKMTPLGPEFIVFKIFKSASITFQTGPFLCFPGCQLLQLSANLASQLINFLQTAPCLEWPDTPSFSFGITEALISGWYNLNCLCKSKHLNCVCKDYFSKCFVFLLDLVHSEAE